MIRFFRRSSPASALLLSWAAAACSPSGLPSNSGELSLPDIPVVTDGRFQEWAGVPVLLGDPEDAPADAAVDLGAIKGAADGRHLFFTLETGRPVNAQAMRGSILILLDTDADPATGGVVEEVPGIDLVVELSRQDQVNEEGYGTGMALREVGAGGDLGERTNAGHRTLMVAPTFSTDRFEVRLARVGNGGSGLAGEGRSELTGQGVPGRGGDGEIGRADLVGPTARVGFLFVSQGTVLDRTEMMTFRLPPLDPAPPAPWSEPLNRTGEVRILVWNVSSESFRDRPERFARVMGALDPDVLLLDEVFGEVTESHVRTFLARPEMAGETPWGFVLGESGGRQKTIVASRLGIRPEPALQELPYPEGALEALAERFPEGRRLFDLERERGLAGVGGWVDVAGRSVLFVPIDLQSAGYDGSFQDELRILQANVLRGFVAGALGAAGPGHGLVIGGDLNLVGSRTPLDSLVRGLDGGADLVPVDTYRLTDGSMATWRSDGTPFTPGRLDFVLISGATLVAERAFAFDVEELSEELREQLGVDVEDSRLTSDHLPLVVDLSLRAGGNQGSPGNKPG